MVMCNVHQPTDTIRQRVCDLTMCGTPKYLIAEILEIDEDTLNKYYKRELTIAKSEMIERIAKTVANQAIGGDAKAQALYLKTQGASQGWVEKQVVENVSTTETQELKDKLKELESKHSKDF